MREPGEIMAAMPRPGRALKAVLVLVAAMAVACAILVHWVPGGDRVLTYLVFAPRSFLTLNPFPRVWTLLTSGFVTIELGHAIWSLIGLYFLTTDLERRWGGPRLLRFLAYSVVLGNLAVLAGTFIPFQREVFAPNAAFGPFAAVTATAIAWSKENADRQIRFMFFLPISGRTLFWITIGFSFLAILFLSGTQEGALAPFGGVLAGVLFAGNPSPVRTLWLRLRLRGMRRQGGITVEQLLGDSPRPPSKARRKGGPPLRVVPGGLEDDLKNRKPPKDKRYLN